MLLVKHVDPDSGEAWWIPPGGGMLPEERSILDCAVREVFEETGLRVTVGRLICLSDFIEKRAAVHHLELFFLADAFTGELSMENVEGPGPDEDFIRDVKWLSQDEMRSLVVWPEYLVDGFWRDLAEGFPHVRYLGVREG
jgi:ADP-ribose pyrophosphatase YjhB (NUDIX family)